MDIRQLSAGEAGRVFERVASHRKSAIVVQQILDGIEKGSFPPGDKLPSEHRIAKEIGVSRSSVREAMTLLRLRGIITTKQGGGSTVLLSPARDQLSIPVQALEAETLSPFDTHVARETIEPALMDLVVESATAEELEGIERALTAMQEHAETNDLEGCYSANLDFHRAIVHATNNEAIIVALDMIYDILASAHSSGGLWRDVLAEYHCLKQDCSQCLIDHKAIVEAIKNGNAPLAKARYAAHFGNVRDGLYGTESAAEDRRADVRSNARSNK